MSAPSFSPNIPNKISTDTKVSGKNTLIKTIQENWSFAIADELIDAKVDGKKMFCIRVDNAGTAPAMMIGFTPMETFNSSKNAYFGFNGFNGCGIYLHNGDLYYPLDKHHNITDKEICQKAKEIIVILTISNNGKKKEIRFLCDGNQSQSFDAFYTSL